MGNCTACGREMETLCRRCDTGGAILRAEVEELRGQAEKMRPYVEGDVCFIHLGNDDECGDQDCVQARAALKEAP